MEIELIEKGGVTIAKIISNDIILSNAQDAVEIIGTCRFQSAERIIIMEENILPEFFELKSKLAGEILQKFSNYYCRLAIVGKFDNITSKSLRDFILESNKRKQINFVGDLQEAIKVLSK